MIAEIWLCIAAVIALIGAIGFVRFPDFYTRIHAATVVTVGGVCLALLTLFFSTLWTVYSAKILIIIIFILFTSPIAVHALADAAHKKGIKPKKLRRNDLK